MKFFKYHALGNDYLVIDPQDWPSPPTPLQIKVICHRNFGVGSDGILLGPLPSDQAGFALRIFNPDGIAAEKSGNGLRIFSRYLWDRQRVKDEEFDIQTLGGMVRSRVLDDGKIVRVEMGQVSFQSDSIPVTGPPREVINEKIAAGGRTFTFCAATIGNPHCVIPLPEISAELARQYGPLLETDARFPKRTNVQFLKVLQRKNIQIEIWERGAGKTLASGSSISAAAAGAHTLGLCDPSITVRMPAGKLAIAISSDFDILMTGPVTKVAEGMIAAEMSTIDV